MTRLTTIIDSIPTTTLEQLDACAQLHTRKDRKYIIDAEQLAAILVDLPAQARVLDIDGQRSFGYVSTYFDTPTFDSYRLAATRRHRRFKVRVRTYQQSGDSVLEVKTKNRHGQTVKHRLPVAGEEDLHSERCQSFLQQFDEVRELATDLELSATSTYRRTTLVFPEVGTRATIDSDFQCHDSNGRHVDIGSSLIVETKSSGKPSELDQMLWRAGIRPVKVSKYATGLAALYEHLPSNRWHRVLNRHFSKPTTAAAAATKPSHTRELCGTSGRVPGRFPANSQLGLAD